MTAEERDKAQALEVLGEARAEGRISEGELRRRSGEVRAASTYAELTAALTGPPRPEAPQAPPERASWLSALVNGWRSQDPSAPRSADHLPAAEPPRAEPGSARSRSAEASARQEGAPADRPEWATTLVNAWNSRDLSDALSVLAVVVFLVWGLAALRAEIMPHPWWIWVALAAMVTRFGRSGDGA
ncbi:DUF1707 domain-containing protein [Actinosynnema pretiosum subsp. pretiosum]|uniref:DUF1707 domain-containing protein n=1 Tax=Actinosynnema pretiosum subsp. pretiosum TaxID=103721 RepID=A0AA45L3B7_9PSEU|nr:hypothetical protein APASM_6534 [Actinosynnema pretiosum subsp. pretiosum]QUF02348.1 DUF1707 domain-containing protein [Actinosynnema pretiosum subsp. pretiosum]